MTPKNIRVMQALVIFLGLVIVVGMGVIGIVLSQRIREARGPGADAPWEVRIDGATVLAVTLEGNRAAIRIQAADGAQRIEFYDIRTGELIGAMTMAP